MSGQLCLKWNNHTIAFNKILSKIYFKDIYSDATLLCENKCYPVHRLVLSTCSDYFEEIFQQCANTNHKHPFIIIKEVHSEQLEALLNYMYKGEVNVPQEILPELIKAAEVFKIKGLAVPDEEEEASPKPSKKRSHPPMSSPSAVSKKSRKQLSRERAYPESNNEKRSEQNETSEIYLTEEKPIIKSEPLESAIEVIDEEESQTSSLKDEEYQNYTEPESNYEDFDLENSSQVDFEQPQSTSWDNSQGFAEKPQDSNPSDNMNISPIDTQNNQSFEYVQPRAYTRRKKSEGPHSCRFCDYKSYSTTLVVRHERKHTGEKPFSCWFCDYKSTHKTNLKTHLMTHTGEKPYECPHCDYKASQKKALTRHMQSHAGEKL